MRPNIGIPADHRCYQLDPMFGMHPAMAPLKPFWDAGTFGVCTPSGMPQPNRSHFEAMEEMERAAPGTSLRTGWIDRVLGAGATAGTAFQGDADRERARRPRRSSGPSPELAMWSVDAFGLDAAWRRRRSVRGGTRRCAALHAGAPRPAAAAGDDDARRARRRRRRCRRPATRRRNGAVVPGHRPRAALSDVARLIKADVGLQVAAIDYGDWDMHAGMGDVDAGWMHDQLTELSGSLAAFATDLGTDG